MSQRLVPQLPKSLRSALSSEYLANEAEYWRVRDRLLSQYAGKWAAVHNGQVVVCGDDMLAVMDEVGQKGYPQAYIDKVGEEGELQFRCRQVTFGYNQAYLPTALPQATVTFSNFYRTHQQTFTDVIPDTGSDFSALTENDRDALRLLAGPHAASSVAGLGGLSSLCIACRAFAQIGGRLFPSLIQVIPGQSERLLGREVMNRTVVTFDGPNGQVTFDV
jgi:hypothetical protein